MNHKTWRAVSRPAVLLTVALLLSACAANNGSGGVDGFANGWLAAAPEDLHRDAERAFHRGNYGVAETHYRTIVARDEGDVDAWVGLGASYDMLGRFDLADQAYQKALATGKKRAAVLNNMGYSHYLRGDRKKALDALYKAKNLEPGNRRIQGNIELVTNGG